MIYPFPSQPTLSLQQVLLILPQNVSSLSLVSGSHYYFPYPSWGTENWALVILPRGGLQTLLSTVSWYWSHQRKHNTVKYCMEQCSPHTKKRQSKVSCKSGHQYTVSRSLPAADTGLLACMQPSCTTEQRSPSPFCREQLEQ